MIINVFIHGAGGSAKHWLPLTNAMADEHSLYYEMPGHGDRENFLSDNIDTAFIDFVDFINHRRIKQFNLIAHSLGGLIAIKYAVKFPGNLLKLVLIATAAKILIHPEMLKHIYEDNNTVEFILEGFKGAISDTNKELVIADFKRLKLNKNYANDFMAASQYNLNEALSNIMIPTLVLAGELDRIISPRRTRELSKKISTAKLINIPNAGHYPHLENIQFTASTIKNFITDDIIYV
jgi:2-succinyl-6-hydroxy-2,4-cyclohexadiene-1-carboxylate synthase